MTETAPREDDPSPLDEAAVARYLAEHPDLLQRRPELLAQLELRHDCGPATSLIEHQVRVLREHNAALRQRLDELLSVARYNDGTAERLHELTLELMGADDLQDAVEGLRSRLREGFQAEAVAVVLFGPAGQAAEAALPELTDGDASAYRSLEPLLEGGRPRCGAPDEAQGRIVFGASAPRVASAALVPLIAERRIGVLGIGSADPERYHAGQGTVFLRRLGALAAYTFERLMRSG